MAESPELADSDAKCHAGPDTVTAHLEPCLDTANYVYRTAQKLAATLLD